MWQDINTSKGTTEKFKKALQEEGIELGIDFSVKLLSTGSWPLTKVFGQRFFFGNYYYFRRSAWSFQESCRIR